MAISVNMFGGTVHDGGPAPLEEWPSTPEHYRSRQPELNPRQPAIGQWRVALACWAACRPWRFPAAAAVSSTLIQKRRVIPRSSGLSSCFAVTVRGSSAMAADGACARPRTHDLRNASGTCIRPLSRQRALRVREPCRISGTVPACWRSPPGTSGRRSLRRQKTRQA